MGTREERLLGWWLPGKETRITKKRFARLGRCCEEQVAGKRQMSVNAVEGNQRECLPNISPSSTDLTTQVGSGNMRRCYTGQRPPPSKIRCQPDIKRSAPDSDKCSCSCR